MPSTEEIIAAGLYDPRSKTELGRLELLDWLAELGFTIDEMVSADSAGGLSAVANDRRTLPGERLSRTEAIERSGMAAENFDAFLRAVGLTRIGGAPDGEVGVTQAEVDALARGRVYAGDRAKQVGLVDRLGGFSSALARARQLAGLPRDAGVVVRPKRPERLLDYVLGNGADASAADVASMFDFDVASDGAPPLSAELRSLVRLTAIGLLGESGAPLALMPYEITL